MSPSILLVYLYGINRFFKERSIDLDELRDAIFNSDQGYMTAVNSIVKRQQADGAHRKPTNFIIEEEISRMLSHDLTNPLNPKEYATRLMFLSDCLLIYELLSFIAYSGPHLRFARLMMVNVLTNMSVK